MEDKIGLTSLPQELILLILGFLDTAEDLCSVSYVCLNQFISCQLGTISGFRCVLLFGGPKHRLRKSRYLSTR